MPSQCIQNCGSPIVVSKRGLAVQRQTDAITLEPNQNSRRSNEAERKKFRENEQYAN